MNGGSDFGFLNEMGRAAAVLFVLQCFFIIPIVYLHGYIERKFAGDLQARVGPNRVGPAGALQGLADAIKLMQKGRPGELGRAEVFWFSCQIASLHLALAALPVAKELLLSDPDLGILIPLWGFAVLSVNAMMAGSARGRLQGVLFSVRTATQATLGLMPAVFVICSVAVHAGGFSWQAVLDAQGAFPFSWSLFANPFLFVGFFVFIVAGMIILSLPPFASSWGDSDLQRGQAGVAGVGMAIMAVIRMQGRLIWSVMVASLFLGGWRLPGDSHGAFWGLQMMVVGVKALFILLIISVIGAVMPRIRVDHVNELSWRVLGPVSLICLIGSALWSAGGALL